MNRAMLVGRLTAKPELRYTSSNVPYARFSIAVNRPFSSQSGERGTDFINIIIWRKQAENVCNFLDKGSLVSVEGRIQTGNFNDKDGNKRYTFDVVADNVQFLESKNARRNSEESGGYDYQPEMPANDGVNVDTDPFADFGDGLSIDDNFLE